MKRSSRATQGSGEEPTSLATGTAAGTTLTSSLDMKVTPSFSLTDVCSLTSTVNESHPARINELSTLKLDKKPIGSACAELEPAILKMIPVSAYIVLPQVPLARVNLTGNQYENETRILSDWVNRQHVSGGNIHGKRESTINCRLNEKQ